ncbi:AraC family transcriptional regulator [uncultured Chitinophaga sp.]|uniref:AraC family transcriptional regulator n=1 Tax=uncultured Chitinophaga sp. TaxID=339340 RepID=UPI0025FB9966|nr:AraC family transcriptional regulator [uncultured Chitinophaga sp.]
MPRKSYLQNVDLTPPHQLQTLVENRRVFNLKNCELNIFECYQPAWHLPLAFSDFVITSMMRGKKVMHLYDDPAFDYLPGETVIIPAHETMHIDFPESTTDTPTQCMALAVDEGYMQDTLSYLNNYYNNSPDENTPWDLQFSQYHFSNNTEITDLINKIIRVCSSSDKTKNIFADLSIKELLIRLIQNQRMYKVSAERTISTNETRSHFVLSYIHEHLSEKIAVDVLCRKAYLSRNMFFKWFKEQFGISPLEYINNERVKQAKQLLTAGGQDIRTISEMCGFNDVNYFTRVFKKVEGITPGGYREYVGRYQPDSI